MFYVHWWQPAKEHAIDKQSLGGTESAILNRESCDSNRAIPRSQLSIDRMRFGGDSESIFCDSIAI